MRPHSESLLSAFQDSHHVPHVRRTLMKKAVAGRGTSMCMWNVGHRVNMQIVTGPWRDQQSQAGKHFCNARHCLQVPVSYCVCDSYFRMPYNWPIKLQGFGGNLTLYSAPGPSSEIIRCWTIIGSQNISLQHGTDSSTQSRKQMINLSRDPLKDLILPTWRRKCGPHTSTAKLDNLKA